MMYVINNQFSSDKKIQITTVSDQPNWNVIRLQRVRIIHLQFMKKPIFLKRACCKKKLGYLTELYLHSYRVTKEHQGQHPLLPLQQEHNQEKEAEY